MSALSASLGALAQLSVGLTVCSMDDGYFVTAYRRHAGPDERRVSFRITTETFLAFADEVAALAEAERYAAEHRAIKSAVPAEGVG